MHTEYFYLFVLAFGTTIHDDRYSRVLYRHTYKENSIKLEWKKQETLSFLLVNIML